ncbi:MAG: hypothetical protein AAB518_01690 [Patescibacteria group bacterium]
MAIVFQPQKKQVNWVKILFIVFSIAFVIFSAYFLFFAASPRIDVVLPEPLRRASQISKLNFIDPSDVIDSQTFRRLQTFFPAPGVGVLGRTNPFASF